MTPWLLLCFASPPTTSTLTLSLEDALTRARQGASEVARAELDVLAAATDRDRAIALILPSATLGLDAREYFFGNQILETRFVQAPESTRPEDRDDLDLVYGPFRDQKLGRASHPGLSLVLSFRQLLFDGGRFWEQILRADDWAENREWILAAARNNASLEALRRFYAFARARESLVVAEAQVRLAEDNRARSLSMGKDLALAERDVASDQVRLARARYAVSATRRSLALYLALDPDLPIDVVIPEHAKTSSLSISVAQVSTLLEHALSSRPEILASQANLAYVARTLDIERAGHWPTVAVTGSYSRSSRRPDRVFADPTTNYVANTGLTISLPLYAGGDVMARVERSEIELARARRQHEDLVRDLRSEVIDRRQRIDLLSTVLRLARTEANAAEKAMKAAQTGYLAGTINATEERDAELRWVEARRSVIESRYDVEIGLAELTRAIGGSISESPESLDPSGLISHPPERP